MSGLELAYIEEAIASNWIAPIGPHVQALEEEVAAYAGSAGAVALSSGTAGIHLALLAAGVHRHDVVFCSTFTFVASANPILYVGAVPVFIDSEHRSWNMSAEALERAFVAAKKQGRLPKAVIVTSLYGQSADMQPILELCATYGAVVIEDAAESLGATYNGQMSGSLGRFGVFSFNGNKVITTSGGGMIISNDLEALDKIRYLATQARESAPYYQHSEIGYNYRLSNLLASVGLAQMRVLDERIEARRQIFKRYQQGLADVPGIGLMPEASYGASTRWLSAITVDAECCKPTAAELVARFEEYNIETRRLWKPLHLQPLFRGCEYYTADDGFSERAFLTGLCLPSGSNLLLEEQEWIISLIREWVNR